MQNRVALNQIQIGDDLTRQFTCIPRKPETRYAGIRLSGGRTSLSLDHSARNARAGVVPAVFVGIGQLAGCNGAIRSAVPFRCFASRTYSLSLSLSPSFSLPLCLSTIYVAVLVHTGFTSVGQVCDPRRITRICATTCWTICEPMRKTDGRLYILIATRILLIYRESSRHFPPFPRCIFSILLSLLYFAIHILFPFSLCNDFDIFATDGRREYTCEYTLYTYISRGVQATLLRADVFVWPSFHWLRKKRGRVVKVQSVKRRVMNLDLIYILRYFLFFLFFFISNYYSYSIS